MPKLEIPEDTPAEQALLVTLCQDGAETALASCLPQLGPADFMHPAHRAVFEAMQAVYLARTPVNGLTLRAELERLGRLNLVGGLPGLADLLGGEEVARPQVLVDILRGHRRRRELVSLGSRIQRMGQDTLEDPEDTIHEAQVELARIMRDGRRQDGEDWVEILAQMASFGAFRRPGAESGGRWGLPTLDQVAPIPTGEYVTVGARPGVGKTALMTQIAVESARHGVKTLVLSLELAAPAMRARLASYLSEVPVQDLRRGLYRPEHVTRVGEQGGLLGLGRMLCPGAGTPWSRLEALIRHEVDQRGVQLVLLDQFDKIGRPEVKKGSSEAYAFGAVSVGIMALAQELDLGFVLLCQLRSDADGREPTLADHADSDRPGKDAAVVVHLWRNKDGDLRGKIQKNRDGAYVGKRLVLELRGESQHVYEVEQATDSEPEPIRGKGFRP